jgi:hypothetical protein
MERLAARVAVNAVSRAKPDFIHLDVVSHWDCCALESRLQQALELKCEARVSGRNVLVAIPNAPRTCPSAPICFIREGRRTNRVDQPPEGLAGSVVPTGGVPRPNRSATQLS